MININQINASGDLDIESIVIDFVIDDTTENIDEYVFTMQRSNNLQGPFKTICDDVKNFEFIDKDVNLKNNNIEYYYKVLIKAADGMLNESKITSYKSTFSKNILGINMMHYIQWNENKYLKTVINNDQFFLLRKIQYGELCPNCYDDIRDTPKLQFCNVCYGTGYKNGYFNPAPILINFDTPVSSSEMINQGNMTNQDSPIQAWTSSYPRLHTGDVIVGSKNDNQRYRIMNTTTTRRNQFTSRQIFQMQVIPPSDIIYLYDVKGG